MEKGAGGRVPSSAILRLLQRRAGVWAVSGWAIIADFISTSLIERCFGKLDKCLVVFPGSAVQSRAAPLSHHNAHTFAIKNSAAARPLLNGLDLNSLHSTTGAGRSSSSLQTPEQNGCFNAAARLQAHRPGLILLSDMANSREFASKAQRFWGFWGNFWPFIDRKYR